jgi:hypothetical protein
MPDLLFTYNSDDNDYSVVDLEDHCIVVQEPLCSSGVREILGIDRECFILNINTKKSSGTKQLKIVVPEESTYQEVSVKVHQGYNDYTTKTYYEKSDGTPEFHVSGKKVNSDVVEEVIEEILNAIFKDWDYDQNFLYFKTKRLLK